MIPYEVLSFGEDIGEVKLPTRGIASLQKKKLGEKTIQQSVGAQCCSTNKGRYSMQDALVIQLARDAFYYVLLISGPLLIMSLIVGLLISIFQAATSISEQTLTYVPKLVITFLVTVLVLPFMLSNLKTYTIQLFQMIPTLK